MNDLRGTGKIAIGDLPVDTWTHARGLVLKDISAIAQAGAEVLFREIGHSFLLVQSTLRAPSGPMKTMDLRSVGDVGLGPDTIAVPIVRRPESQMAFVSIGRLEGNDIPIADVSVSKFHAFIKEIGGADHILDAGSRNGTFVDDEAVPVQRQGQPLMLHSGARIRFGAVRTTYMSAGALSQLIERLGV